jgi:hypothetical protein
VVAIAVHLVEPHCVAPFYDSEKQGAQFGECPTGGAHVLT